MTTWSLGPRRTTPSVLRSTQTWAAADEHSEMSSMTYGERCK